jgi:hypothetical protein
MKNLTTWSGLDKSPYDYKKPTVVRFLSHKKNYSWEPEPRILFAVVGTEYGYLHTSAGDVRTWCSYSGTRKAAIKYIPF